MKRDNNTQKIVTAALFAALTCIATMLICIPSPMKGYLNPGDCVVLAAGWMLSPAYGFMAAGMGSALADLFSGYTVYAPATFLIKGAMALAAGRVFDLLRGRFNELPARILSAAAAELIMIGGYFVFEGILYGFAASLINIPANAVQGAFGLILGCSLAQTFKKAAVIRN